MVVPTDIQVSFITGAFLADLGGRAIQFAAQQSPDRSRSLYGQYLFRALAYPAVFVGPAATAFMLGWPAWESQYLSARFEATADAPLNAALYGVFLALLFVGGWLGTWLGFRWVCAGARTRLRVVYGSVFVFTLALFLGRWPAPIRLGSYADFHEDPASLPFIWQNSAFFSSFWLIMAYTTIPLVIWSIRIRQNVKALPASTR